MKIAFIDFGSQYAHLLQKQIERMGYQCIVTTLDEIPQKIDNYEGIVLSGGPKSVYEDTYDYSIFRAALIHTRKPVIGICYGMQLLAHLFGCTVKRGEKGEYGLTLLNSEPIKTPVWMSHMDTVTDLANWACLLRTESGCPAIILHDVAPMIGMQFHPEVKHTEDGDSIMANAFKSVGLAVEKRDHSLDIPAVPKDIDRALMAFSGGVDSLVAATYVAKHIGDRLTCLFIDNGFIRNQDLRHLSLIKEKLGLNIEIFDAKSAFIHGVMDIEDPEEKRKFIGREFINTFKSWAENHKGYNYLIQGTIFPDRIESSKGSNSADVIKSHHNVGGLPEELGFKLYEPLMNLYKDDVRRLGTELGLPTELVNRHPFPGPGLAIRIPGKISWEKRRIAVETDEILFQELTRSGFYNQTWQAFTVVLPVKSVGVKGDNRSYENVVAIRMVNSADGMTANWTKAPYELLDQIATRIINEVSGVNRVVYDISNKPASTIEWE